MGDATHGRHCEEPRKRRRSNPVSDVPQTRHPHSWHRRFLDCFALASLGLAMTGENARERAMAAEYARACNDGERRAGCGCRPPRLSGVGAAPSFPRMTVKSVHVIGGGLAGSEA